MISKHLLAILATWRVTEILNSEAAPFELALKLRRYAYKHGSYSVIPDYDTGKMKQANSPFWREINDMLSCTWCLSVHVGLLIAIITRVNPLWGFAYSAGSLLFDKIFRAIPELYVDRQVFDNGN